MGPNLLGSERDALTKFLADSGVPAFHARQLLKWIHARGVTDYAAMTDLAVKLREQLTRTTSLEQLPLIKDSVASDGTRKFLFAVGDEAAIETVWIPETSRTTLCVSSQAGCALGCTFCLTGKQGFSKNLSSWQIISQIHQANALAGRVTNVVFMGMGEPLLNLEAVIPAVKLLIDPLAYGLSRRKVTVSTAGVVPGIARLAKLAPVALAVSLHAVDDDLRNEIVPLNRRYPVAELLEACQQYLAVAPRDFITFEYALLKGVNDSVAHAKDLVNQLRHIYAKINLIPFNPFPGAPYQAPSKATILRFRDELNNAGVVATIRRQRGEDILAACGQLAGEVSGRMPTSGRMAIAPVTQ